MFLRRFCLESLVFAVNWYDCSFFSWHPQVFPVQYFFSHASSVEKNTANILLRIIKERVMTSMFTTPPAGTPVEPTNGVRYYYRRQVYPATPSTKENFQSGREIQWRFQASGQHAFVPQESRLCARVRVEKSANNGTTWAVAAEDSIRYAADPLSRLIDQARLSINGTTVDNVQLGDHPRQDYKQFDIPRRLRRSNH